MVVGGDDGDNDDGVDDDDVEEKEGEEEEDTVFALPGRLLASQRRRTR